MELALSRAVAGVDRSTGPLECERPGERRARVATGSDRIGRVAPGFRRIAYGLVAVAVVLLVVGAGTGVARSEDHDGGVGDRWAVSDPGWLLNAAVSLFTVAGVAVALVLVYAFWPGGWRRRRAPDVPEPVYEPPFAPWWARAAAVASPLALVGGVVWALVASRSSDGSAPAYPPVAAPGSSPSPAQQPGTPAPMIHWWVVAAVVAAVVGLAAVVLVALRRRRRVSVEVTLADRREVVIGAVDDSLDALEAEPDGRRAVIKAYSRMEGWLARAGVPRAAWEAPFEYVDRVLIELGAPAAIVATLTELFERAKFGPHPVSGAMKRRAIDVLMELRAALGGTT
jgi:Domain of unknown function (DUF4129)